MQKQDTTLVFGPTLKMCEIATDIQERHISENSVSQTWKDCLRI